VWLAFVTIWFWYMYLSSEAEGWGQCLRSPQECVGRNMMHWFQMSKGLITPDSLETVMARYQEFDQKLLEIMPVVETASQAANTTLNILLRTPLAG
jgi:hypothetical protein